MSEQEIKQIDELTSIGIDLSLLINKLKNQTPTRGCSIAITNLETASLWLKSDLEQTKAIIAGTEAHKAVEDSLNNK